MTEGTMYLRLRHIKGLLCPGNVAITQVIATLGPAWASASKQYWAKIGATRGDLTLIQYILFICVKVFPGNSIEKTGNHGLYSQTEMTSKK